MKRKLVLVLLVSFMAVSPCFGGDIEAEVKALLEKHDKAFSEQNLPGVMEVYSSDADIVLMGTGPGELYKGREGIEGAYSQFFKNFAPGTLTHDYYWMKAGSLDDAAWFMAMSQSSANAGDAKKDFGINLSGALRKENGTWRIVTMHFSALMEGKEAGAQAEAKPQ